MIIFSIVVILAVVYLAIFWIFQYSIAKRKFKPSKLSKIFYNDDESFNKYWKKTKEKGIFKHVLKATLIMTVMMCIMGGYFLLNKRSMYGEVQSQTIPIALLMGVILGVLISLMQWCFGNDRHNSLKQTGEVESDNVNNVNKKP